ncbi:MAG: hypothetical protein DWI00_07145 [Planctomycetota bacterium]|nr:MAG: hypothetical protein DWI00_07145 [Planctomycetota bacterium]
MPKAADQSNAENGDASGSGECSREMSVLRDRQQLRRRVQQRNLKKLVSEIESHTLLRKKPK